VSNLPTHTPLALEAPAKVNLGFEIIRRRSDGFHDIETIYSSIALTDTVELTLIDDGITMDCTDPSLPAGNTNLCARAADTLRRHTGLQCGVHISLKKRIPHGAGLGGGSSDAAAVLKGLLKLWSIRMAEEEVADLAAGLGSDVSFFLHGGLAFGRGRGEIIQPMPNVFPYWIVCVVPPVRIATSWAYANHKLVERPNRTSLLERFTGSVDDMQSLERTLSNDFERAVMEAQPAVRHVRDALRHRGLRCVMMSGSGSSVFGLTTDAATALHATSDLSSDHVVSVTPPRFAP